MSGKHACDNNKKKKEEPIEFVENEKKVKKEKVKTNKKKKGRWLKVLGTILLTIILILAILIKIDSKGPVFYRQERVTTNGKIFRIFLLRIWNK